MANLPDLKDELRAPDSPVDAGSQALSEALRSSFSIVKFVTLVLVILFVCSGFFTVGTQERAIIIRLGKPQGQGEKALLGPGLHFSLPYPIDEYIKVPITAIQKVDSTVGWFALSPEEKAGAEPVSYPVTTPMNPLIDGSLLTADANIIHSSATLTYHIADPVGFIFNFRNASNAVQNALDNALIYAASRYNVDDILRSDQAGFRETVRKRAADLIENGNLGVVVEDCTVHTRPPRQLQDAFASVIEAEVRRNKYVDQARTYESQTLNRANSDAQQRINSAKYERTRLVKDTSSQADRFKELLPRFRENPNLFVQQRLTEALGRILTNAQEKIFLTDGSGNAGGPRELRLLLNREPPKTKPEETPTTPPK